MISLVERFVTWLLDPYGRKELDRRHKRSVAELHAVGEQVRLLAASEKFPISRAAGNPTLRWPRGD